MGWKRCSGRVCSACSSRGRRYPDVEVTYYVEPEGSTKVLLRHAAEAQLVVVGNRRHNALAGAVLGSTSLNLLYHSPVPVMLCHRGPRG